MSQQPNKFSPQDILAEGLANGPASTDPEVLQMQKGLLALQLKKLTEEMGEQDENKRIQLEARKQNAFQLEEARKKTEFIQSLCPHQKPNGQPAIAGPRDHQHNYIFICAYCSKTFNQHTLPPHLRIPSERVGGPEA